LSQDTVDVIPVLKKILAINPNLKIMASPWSPPVWMKTNKESKGGNLTPQYYAVYAQYFVKYIQQMRANGIPIDAITLQNEPEHGGNNPSMLMTPEHAIDFVKNHLGPAFKTAGIATKIIVWDHNCDKPTYPITVLNDPAAKAFINGSAFHLYAGNISALTQVYNAHPDKDLYFTEQWTGSKGEFAGDFKWHIKNVMIGSMRNRSRVALEWNLANNAAFEPHTEGGCTECKGALTIQNGQITRNVAYYIIAQLSKFVPAGSVRIASDNVGQLQTVAFKTPENKTVLVVLNEGNSAESFNIGYHGKWIVNSIAAGTAATYVW
jgi:glucosylceramidase